MTTSAVLARIRLNPHSREVQRDLRDATQMHRTLMRLVPDSLGDTPRHAASMLYRIDETDRSSTVIVQAATPLDPARLPVGYGHTDTRDLSPMFAAFKKGLAVRYRIVVNPVKRERLPLDQKGKRGKAIPLSGPDADQWWTRRATASGLEIHTVIPTPLTPIRARGENSGMRHSLIRYDGTGLVTDPETLTHAVLTGIGRAKSYGAGLLSLAPAAAA
ncbi:type I-E CRISPR-associated protein Cas6/Cse3/CasE [Streptomyces cavernae]|uniref:type I-E CRISPR-associated protein Cas6/Cse3/CasE n=1 Tax=Streptomyces cavernae TaxID=2259034 RepID=UPI000FEB9B27|nr:type I-E CRISPR-associated protein Cas6/Cse3/CasE [Streptomyces cavernae]